MTIKLQMAAALAVLLTLMGCTGSPKPDPNLPPPPRPIYSIDAVSAVMTRKMPPSVVLKVRGVVNSGGWTNFELRPLQTVAPEVEVMSFTMYGQPPAPKAVVSQAFAWETIELTIDPLPEGVRRIRILSSTDEKTAELYR